MQAPSEDLDLVGPSTRPWSESARSNPIALLVYIEPGSDAALPKGSWSMFFEIGSRSQGMFPTLRGTSCATGSRRGLVSLFAGCAYSLLAPFPLVLFSDCKAYCGP